MKTQNTPIIVSNTEWDVADSIIKEVQAERMINALCDLMKPKEKDDLVGDAEVIAYLMPATLRTPVSSEISDIYLYCCRQVMEKRRMELPDFLDEHKELSNYRKERLKELKLRIYESRGGKYQHPFLSILKEVFFEKQQKLL